MHDIYDRCNICLPSCVLKRVGLDNRVAFGRSLSVKRVDRGCAIGKLSTVQFPSRIMSNPDQTRTANHSRTGFHFADNHPFVSPSSPILRSVGFLRDAARYVLGRSLSAASSIAVEMRQAESMKETYSPVCRSESSRALRYSGIRWKTSPRQTPYATHPLPRMFRLSHLLNL